MAPTRQVAGSPKAPRTAFAMYAKLVCELYSKMPGAVPRNLNEISQQCHQMWLDLPAEEKARFEKQAEDDAVRYRRELEAFNRPVPVAPVAPEKKKKAAKKPRDPNRPKRPLTSFLRFANEERANVRALYPQYTMTEVSKELGCRWKFLDASEKARYELLSENAKDQYRQEMQEYLNNLQSQI